MKAGDNADGLRLEVSARQSELQYMPDVVLAEIDRRMQVGKPFDVVEHLAVTAEVDRRAALSAHRRLEEEATRKAAREDT
jgi:hypothetical protein